MRCSKDFRWLLSPLFLPSLLFQAPLPDRDSFTIRDNVNLVVLDVGVTGPEGRYVPGLQKSNFRVLEDGRPRKISQFGTVDAPVTVGLVVDDSGSMRSKRAEIVEAGLAFARASNPQDQFFVVRFNNSVVLGLPKLLPFSGDLEILRRALNAGSANGQTALYDAVSYSLRHLELSRQEQRTLVIVSDGGDNVSKIPYPALLKEIESSRASIYAIGLLDPENSDLNPGVLRKFAAISGGEFFKPRTLSEVRSIFERISNDIRSRYSIGFVPDESGNKNARRTVKVLAETRGKRLTVKSRTSFRIPPAIENL